MLLRQSRLLPGRALIKKKLGSDGKVTQVGENKGPPQQELVPYIPRELAADTIDFFRNNTKVKALLELIFSSEDAKDSAEDRKEFEESEAKLSSALSDIEASYRAHEVRAEELCFNAIRELPADLYAEAVLNSKEPMPRAFMLHVMYNKQWFSELSEPQLTKLQAFENLMHVRYPHSEMRKKKPELFWVPANQVVSKQQEIAMKNAANARAKR